jgi:hypothetical protein
MHLNSELILWVSGVALHILLLAVLFACGRIRRFPFFTLLIFFYVLRSLALYVTFNKISRPAYNGMRLDMALADVLLETLVLLSLAWLGLKGAGYKPRLAIPGVIVGLAVAASLPIYWGEWPPLVWPGSPDFDWSMLGSVIASKGNLFIQGLSIVVALSVLASSRLSGLRWTSHVRRLLQGFFAYAVVSILITLVLQHMEATLKPTTMAEYQAALAKLRAISYIPTATYFLAVIYWIVTLWKDESAALPTAPSEIVALPEELPPPSTPEAPATE